MLPPKLAEQSRCDSCRVEWRGEYAYVSVAHLAFDVMVCAGVVVERGWFGLDSLPWGWDTCTPRAQTTASARQRDVQTANAAGCTTYLDGPRLDACDDQDCSETKRGEID